MPNISEMAEQIARIGRSMVSCRLACEGIALDPAKGIIPRALVFETDGRHSDSGSIVLGINPGWATDKERSYYIEHGLTYQVHLEWYRTNPAPYHVFIKPFLSAVGLDGPILWTELMKCENPPATKALPPVGTIRTCVNLHLVQELSVLPANWPILAIGRKPFELAAIMFPARPVIGIPHPRSYGHFHRLFPQQQLAQVFRTRVQDVLSSSRADWIAAIPDAAEQIVGRERRERVL